jgi:hypothetical protein
MLSNVNEKTQISGSSPTGSDVVEPLDFAVPFGSNDGIVNARLIGCPVHLRAKTAFRLLQSDVGLTMKQCVHGDVPTYCAAKHSDEFDLVIGISQKREMQNYSLRSCIT